MIVVFIKICRLFFIAAFIVICAAGFAESKTVNSLKPDIQVDYNNQKQQALKTEEEAKSAAQTWDGESTGNSLNLYLTAAGLWTNLRENGKGAACLRRASQLELMLGHPENSFSLLERALRLENNHDNAAGKSETLGLLSLVALQMGDTARAENLFNRALTLSSQPGVISTPEAKATALSSAAEFYYQARDLKKSIEYYGDALKIRQEAQDQPGEAKTLVLLAYAYMADSDPSEGLKLAEKALLIWQELNDRRGLALTNIAAGHMHVALDEKQLALSSYQKAESIFPPDIDNVERAMLYGGLSSVYQDYGDLPQSFSYLTKALEIYRSEQHLHGQASVLKILGILSCSGGDFAAALEYLNQALPLAQKISDFDVAAVRQELGNLYFAKNDDDTALLYYQKAINIMEKSGYKRGVAEITDKLGQIYERRGKTDLARQNYLSALETNRLIKARFSETETLFHLARFNASLGQIDTALQLIEESLNLTESLRGEVFSSKMRRTFLAQVYDRYELYINLLMRQHERFPQSGYDRRALQASEKARARTLLETLEFSDAPVTGGDEKSSELSRRERELRGKINLRANALTDLLSSNSPDQFEAKRISDEIEELNAAREDIKTKLNAANPRYSALNTAAAFDVEKFQREILDDKTLLLEFSLGKDKSFLWTVEKDKITGWSLPPASELEASINRLAGYLGERQMRIDEEIEAYQQRMAVIDAGYERESGELGKILLNPILDKIKGKRLLVVPDGSLNYFPLTALPLPSGDPLVLENEIVYQPSASTLLALEENRRKSAPGNKDLLVFADPIFSEKDARLARKEQNYQPDSNVLLASSLRSFDLSRSYNGELLPRLPASKTEAEAIADAGSGGSATVFTNEKASYRSLSAANVKDYRIIHFATHSLINKENPELSGIVLSLFDENGAPQENGFLRLNDIYNLDLNCDMVVLSACSSGTGKEIRGEGIMSLTRGFIQAGSRSVVSSMWKVDDQATAKLMKYFYDGMLRENLPPGEALRKAQIKIRQNPQWHSPFFWAAFNLQGEYRQKFYDGWTNTQKKLLILTVTGVIGLLALFFRSKIFRRNQ